MEKFLKSVAHKLGKCYCKRICREEYKSQAVRAMNERPIEYSFVFRQLLRTCPTTVLDVGTGTIALPDLIHNCGFMVTATDNVSDYWPTGMFNRHFHVINDDITHTQIRRTFDFIICISVLEHIVLSHDAISNMFQLLNTGGYLVLSFPYNENKYVPNVYKIPSAGYGQKAPYICLKGNFGHLEKDYYHRSKSTNTTNTNYHAYYFRKLLLMEFKRK